MRTEEIAPLRSSSSFGSRHDSMLIEHVRDRAATDFVTHVLECSPDSRIAPERILSSHSENQGSDLLHDSRTAWTSTPIRVVELLSDETTMPGEDRLRLHQCGELAESFEPDLLPENGKLPSLGVREGEYAAAGHPIPRSAGTRPADKPDGFPQNF